MPIHILLRESKVILHSLDYSKMFQKDFRKLVNFLINALHHNTDSSAITSNHQDPFLSEGYYLKSEQ